MEEYKALLADYASELENKDFAAAKVEIEAQISDLESTAKAEVEKAEKRKKKSVAAEFTERIDLLKDKLLTAKEALWLTEKFKDGLYSDIPGLCKIASRAEIEQKNWSLTPGAYVGVAPVAEEDGDFSVRMAEIHSELRQLQTKANALMDIISENFAELRG